MILPGIDYLKSKFPQLDQINSLPQGGQKIVFRAVHTIHGNIVLKIFKQSGTDERSIREIEVAINYHFSNVPKLHQSGSVDLEDGATYMFIIEEFIDGRTLREVFNQEQRLSLNVALKMVKVLLTIAVELEEQKLVHRDIKPENIMLDANGTFWLLDFGIARHLDKSSLTATGAHFGPHTAGYAAPEQFRNYKKDIDIRADLFAIGVVTYEAISGVHPFALGAQNVLDILYRTETVLPNPLIIEGDSQRQFSGFIQILMEKFPSRRPASAALAKQWFTSLLTTIKL